MIDIQDKSACCGCGVCVASCPQRCIALREDDEGFRYPRADADRCIQCGVCETVCPLHTPRLAGQPGKAYAAWHRDAAIRAASSSGGVFTALAHQMLRQGGVVFGAAFDGQRLLHTAVKTPEELAALRGSKYLPSDALGAYAQAYSLLEEGIPVLFTGTPCQIAAVKALVGPDTPGLVTCEVLCHGVPSEKVYRRYTEHVGDGRTVSKATFRDKSKGWRAYGVVLKFESGTPYWRTHRQDPFMIAYLKNLCLRPSCHACAFAGPRRGADITLGDFWGIARSRPQWDDDRGTSLVLTSSAAGETLLQACADELVLHPCDLELALPGNPALTAPAPTNPLREQFLRDVDTMPFAQLQRVYLQPRESGSLPRRALSKLLWTARRWLKGR